MARLDRQALKKATKILSQSRLTIALTGAGISVESGIPPFRGPGSLWEGLDPMDFSHIDAFTKNPARVWEVLVKRLKTILDKAKPNPGHLALCHLEQRGLLAAIVTQNVDSLHQKAGSREVIEFHGTFARLSCMACEETIKSESLKVTTLPPTCPCGGIYRPDCVFFGEAIAEEALLRSQQLALASQAVLVVGTSALVQPAAMVPTWAKQSGATVIEVNPAPTTLTATTTDIFLQGNAGHVLPLLIQECTILLP